MCKTLNTLKKIILYIYHLIPSLSLSVTSDTSPNLSLKLTQNQNPFFFFEPRSKSLPKHFSERNFFSSPRISPPSPRISSPCPDSTWLVSANLFAKDSTWLVLMFFSYHLFRFCVCLFWVCLNLGQK